MTRALRGGFHNIFFLPYCKEKLENILESKVSYDGCGRWDLGENVDIIEI